MENKGDSIVVTEESAAGGKRSLKTTDAPGLKQEFNPALCLSGAVGLLALIQFMGWFQFCPGDAFMTVHDEAGWGVIPFTMVLQWLIIGALVGVAFHFIYL